MELASDSASAPRGHGERSAGGRRLRVITGWAAACALVGLFFSTQMVLMSTLAGARPVTWGQSVRWGLAFWVLWGVLAWPIAWAGRRWPVMGRGWWRALAVHGVGAAAVSLAHLALVSGWFWLLEAARSAPGGGGAGQSWGEVFRFCFVYYIHWNVFIYAAVLGVAHAFDAARRARDREVAAAELEGRLARAQLDALRMQLHPHFLFNTLHAVSALVHEDPRAAERVVVRLGELLRMTLESASAQESPLREEVAFVERYLEIEKERFRERLTVRTELEPGTLDLPAPTMLLQPLVENAMKHALGARAGACTVEIASRREGGDLIIEVRDDGPGPAAPAPRPGGGGTGLGLSNTNARMARLYGEGYGVTLVTREGGGCIARARVPARGANGSGS